MQRRFAKMTGITPWVSQKFSPGQAKLAAEQEFASFLAEVERRAYKQALFAVRDNDVALDVVQDAMLKLTEKYGSKPASELPLLFQRILQNTIRDHYRRQKVRSLWTTLMSSLRSRDEPDTDPLDTLEAAEGARHAPSPEHRSPWHRGVGTDPARTIFLGDRPTEVHEGRA